jgi:hypothetical protein
MSRLIQKMGFSQNPIPLSHPLMREAEPTGQRYLFYYAKRENVVQGNYFN